MDKIYTLYVVSAEINGNLDGICKGDLCFDIDYDNPPDKLIKLINMMSQDLGIYRPIARIVGFFIGAKRVYISEKYSLLFYHSILPNIPHRIYDVDEDNNVCKIELYNVEHMEEYV